MSEPLPLPDQELLDLLEKVDKWQSSKKIKLSPRQMTALRAGIRSAIASVRGDGDTERASAMEDAARTRVANGFGDPGRQFSAAKVDFDTGVRTRIGQDAQKIFSAGTLGDRVSDPKPSARKALEISCGTAAVLAQAISSIGVVVAHQAARQASGKDPSLAAAGELCEAASLCGQTAHRIQASAAACLLEAQGPEAALARKPKRKTSRIIIPGEDGA
jgi:hypothetical protein